MTRAAALLPGRALRLSDRLTGLRPNARITWQMCTRAEAEALPDGSLKLRDGKQELLIRKNVPGSWSIVPAELLRDPLESANPGAGMVSFTVPAPESGNVELEVTLTPL